MSRRQVIPPERVPMIVRDGSRRRLVTRAVAFEFKQRPGARWFHEYVHVDAAGAFYLLGPDRRCSKCSPACGRFRLGGVDITGTHVRRPQRTFRPMLSATGERVSREQREDSFASLGARKLKRLDVFIENRGLMPEQAGKLWEALGMAYSAPVERDAKGDAERDFQEMAQWPFGDVGFPARVRTPGEEAAARAKFENAIRSGAVVNLDGTPVSPGVLASMCATVLGDLAEPVRKHDRDPHPRIQFHSLSNEQLDEEIQRVANFLKL